MGPMIRAAPAIVLSQYFESRGADFKPIAAAVGLTPGDLARHSNLISLSSFAHLLDRLRQEPGGEVALTRLTDVVATSSSGLIGHMALSAPSLRVYLQCLAGFAPLFISSVEVGFDEARSGTGRFYWRMPSDPDAPLELTALFSVGAIVGRARSISPEGWRPKFVEFEHKEPPDAGRLAELFGKRIFYNADRTSIGFDAASLARRMPDSNEELFDIYIDMAVRLMREQTLEEDLVSRASIAIGNTFASGGCTLDSLAYELRVTRRSLQRRLEKSGTSFEQLVDTVRRVRAERQLRETDKPFQVIAFDLGYQSQSAFTRAVKRWLGRSPREYRQQVQGRSNP